MVIQVKNYLEVREGIELQNTMVSGESFYEAPDEMACLVNEII